MVIDRERRARLLDTAGPHDHDLVGHRHRFDLVVGDVDRGRPRRWCSALISVRICTRSLASRLESGSSNRKTCGIAHDRPPHRHPLALAARELARIAVEIFRESEDIGRPPHLGVDLARVHLGELQAEGHVVEDLHMRVERVVLKHHGDVALLRRARRSPRGRRWRSRRR